MKALARLAKALGDPLILVALVALAIALWARQRPPDGPRRRALGFRSICGRYGCHDPRGIPLGPRPPRIEEIP